MRHNKFGIVLSILLGVLVLVIVAGLVWHVSQQQTQIGTLQHDRDLLESQKTGPQGAAGRNASDAQVLKAVQDYCDSHNQCVGPTGPQGVAGKTVVGPRGLTGANGDSVASVRCNGTSVSFLDASGKVLGSVNMVCLR